MRPVLLLLLGIACACSGCSRKSADMTPEGAVRELVEKMGRAEGDPVQAHAVYELLSAPTKANLTERARRASAATGHEVMPHEMLAPGRFSLRFEPTRMHARVEGGRAVVDVVGLDPEMDHAEIPCVLEEGRWRIEISLPPVMPLERRPEP